MDDLTEVDEVSVGKPVFHFVPPNGWINDPCAPGYDPSTGLFHLFYQWAPNSYGWRDISWGHAASKDLIAWEYRDKEKPTFVPDQPYDNHGIYTGCLHPSGPEGEEEDGNLTIFYSSVNYDPKLIHWTLDEYKRGCEGLSMATSSDGGKTWIKYDDNPILAEEPSNLQVMGFRDPSISSQPQIASLLNDPKDTLYGLISGSIRDQGARTFLYRIQPDNLTKWEYIGPLMAPHKRESFGKNKWVGDLGMNWECTNLFTLKSRLSGEGKGIERTVLIPGSEGGLERDWINSYHSLPSNQKRPRRTPRYANWIMGDISKLHPPAPPSAISPIATAGGTDNEDRGIRLSLNQIGLIDWGNLYALNTFLHPDGRRICWGWIIEEDLGLDTPLIKKKGWTGCLGIPREIHLQVIKNVVGKIKGTLADIRDEMKNVNIVKKEIAHSSLSGREGKVDLVTVGVRPIEELKRLRRKELFNSDHSSHPEVIHLEKLPASYDIESSFSILPDSKDVKVIIHIRQSSDKSIRTSIIFEVFNETLTVDRSKSTKRDDINTVNEIAPHTLFRMTRGDPSNLGPEDGEMEKLELRILVDRDVIEVFANERTAIATRSYSPIEASGVEVEVIGGVKVEEIRVWEMASIGLV